MAGWRPALLAGCAALLAACSTVTPPRQTSQPAGTGSPPSGRAAVVTPQSSPAWQWADSQPLPGAIARAAERLDPGALERAAGLGL